MQAFLGALLPDSGVDIRGAMQPVSTLISATKLENRPEAFKELIITLDQELRLITGTDPDAESEEALPEQTSGGQFYQLTHDYLVPSIRDWLTSDLVKTRTGRAKLRLKDLASLLFLGGSPRFYPRISSGSCGNFTCGIRHWRQRNGPS